MASGRRGRWKELALVVLLVGFVLAVTLYMAFSRHQYEYALEVERAVREYERFAEYELHLQGALVSGTLKKRGSGCGFDFEMQSSYSRGRSVFVHYDECVLPDTICDLPEAEPGEGYEMVSRLTVDGTLERRGADFHFEATSIMARWPGYYWGDLGARPPGCARYRPGFYCPMCEHARGWPPHGAR